MGANRWLHYYCINEVIHLLFFTYLCAYANPPERLQAFPHVVFAILAYIPFCWAHVLLLVLVLCVQRLFRPSRHIDTSQPQYELPTWETFQHKAQDGTELKVRIAKSKSNSSKVMLLAAPLGQCGPDIFNALICWFGPNFTYISWDYRGFFGSEKPARLRRISIPEHANDAFEVLRACGYSKADVMVGHSMGTAVTFEFVLLYPEAVGTFIIMNGFYGQVFSTAFQLIWRIPLTGDVLSTFVNYLMKNPQRLDQVRLLLQKPLRKLLPLVARLFGSKLLMRLSGERYLLNFFEEYIGRICDSRSNIESYVQLFQELDAHSVYHLLPTITHPVLLISGLFDMATPAMQSVAIARQIRHSVHYCDPFSTHCSILESPEWCVAEIEAFARDNGLLSEPAGAATKGDSKKSK